MYRALPILFLLMTLGGCSTGPFSNSSSSIFGSSPHSSSSSTTTPSSGYTSSVQDANSKNVVPNCTEGKPCGNTCIAWDKECHVYGSPSSTSLPTSSPSYSSGSYSSGPVRVKGYYRKDGTYVRPHIRSRPRR